MLTYFIHFILPAFFHLAPFYMPHAHETPTLQSVPTGKPVLFVTVDATSLFSGSHTSFGPFALSVPFIIYNSQVNLFNAIS